jgi:uncharacterized protein YbaR (Trm112 family)
MPNKTPYELRFDVLQMARDLEMQRYEQLNYPFWQLHNQIEDLVAELKEGRTSIQLITKLIDMAYDLKESIPEMPSTEQINQKAKELYEFVEQK